MRYTAIAFIFALLAGCRSFDPVPLETVVTRDRILTDGDDDVTVRVVAFSRDEAKRAFGADLGKEGIQPVWIEIENRMDRVLWLHRIGIDPDYFSPLEAAHYVQDGFSERGKRDMDAYFDQMRFENPVPADTTRSGFVFCNLDEGLKFVSVELLGRDVYKQFPIVASVPGLSTPAPVDHETLYAPDEIVDCDDVDALRAALERLPACTTNKDGTKEGDPITTFLVGNTRTIRLALVRRNWHATEVLDGSSAGRSISAFFSGSSYRHMPISPLYYFGRAQDAGAQKIRGNVHERNHMRLWLTPIRYEGLDVWAVAISRDIGVKMSWASAYLLTHRIDGDMDEVRAFLAQDMTEADAVAWFGVVGGGKPSSRSSPEVNLTGDPYFTDGLRMVLFIADEPVPMNAIRVVDWVLPGGTGLDELVEPGEP